MSKRKESLLLVVCVLSVMFFCALVTTLGYKPNHLLSLDGRYAAELPQFSWRIKDLLSFCRQVDACISDHMVFRAEIIAARNWLRYQIFRVSGANNVAVGKDNWLFFLSDSSLKERLGLSPFSTEELLLWVKGIEERAKKLKRRGISFYIVIGPSKEEIYPEYLATPLRRLSGGESRLDQLLQALRNSSDVHVVDVRKALLEAKSDALVFYKTDTHWNGLGAYLAYRELLNSIDDNYLSVRPLLVDETISKPLKSQGDPGDLSRMLGLGNFLPESLEIYYPSKRKWHYVVPKMEGRLKEVALISADDQNVSFATETWGEGDLPGALVVRDSYASALHPLLSQHFQRADFVWSKFIPEQVVDEQKPRIVIWEFVQRTLYEEIPWLSEIQEVDKLDLPEVMSLPSVSYCGQGTKENLKSFACGNGARIFYNGGLFISFRNRQSYVELPIAEGMKYLSLDYRVCQGDSSPLSIELVGKKVADKRLIANRVPISWSLPAETKSIRLSYPTAPGLLSVNDLTLRYNK